MLFFFLIEPFFEGVEDHTISPFDLAVSSRMSNGNVFNRDAPVFAEVPKMMADKSCPEVGDDAVRETESVYDVFKELDCFLSSSCDEWFVLDPLGELINGDVHVPETSWRRFKRPDHIQSPACEWPGSWNGL